MGLVYLLLHYLLILFMQNQRNQMAVRNGYTHVEKTEHIMFENAGDLTVSVENVMWMNDHTLHRSSFVRVYTIMAYLIF